MLHSAVSRPWTLFGCLCVVLAFGKTIVTVVTVALITTGSAVAFVLFVAVLVKLARLYATYEPPGLRRAGNCPCGCGAGR